MAKRSQSPAQESDQAETPVATPVKSTKVTLRLKQNDFIGGAFAAKGSTITVERALADKLLATEAKWEFVS